MNRQLNELHLRRGRLLERIAAQRADLERDLRPVRASLSRVDRVIGRHRFGDGHDERYGERVPGNACPRPAEPSSGVVHGTGGDHGDGDAAVIVAREPPPLDESACLRMGGIDAFIGGHLVRRFCSPVKSRRCDFV